MNKHNAYSRFVRKLLRYSLLLKNILFRPIKSVSLPAHIQIEVTTYCNQDCLSCGRRDIIEKPKHMRFEQFRKIYDEIRPANINLSGLGEPLLNPDIFKMIDYCCENGSVVNFPTNLTLNEKVIRKLVDTQINQIKVSIDAFTREAYLIARQSDKLAIVKRNISLINSIKAEKNLAYPEIRLNYALQKSNIDELIDVIDYAYANNITTIYIQDLNYFSVENVKNELCGFSFEKLNSVLEETNDRAKKYGINTNIGNWQRNMLSFYNKMMPADDYLINDNNCSFPWVSAFVDVHGMVKPCPVFVWDKDSESLGNCLDNGFWEVWTGNAYQKLRREFKSKIRSNRICQRCIPPGVVDMQLIFSKMLLRK